MNAPFIILDLKATGKGRVECLKRQFTGPGVDSFVCVCNTQTCDTIESIDNDAKDTTYQEWTTSADGHRLDKIKGKLDSSPSKGLLINITFMFVN